MATRISFIKGALLTNVVGRVDYISNPKRQENLLAFCQTPTIPNFWSELSEVSQSHSNYNKGKKVVEAREHIVQLPGDLRECDHYAFAQGLAERFKKKYGVECAVAIHFNATKKSYHAHIIFSERQLLQERAPSIATRNTYFDSNGKRSSKAVCVGADGKLLPGCRLVKKGEAFPIKKFSGKDNTFFTKTFMKAEKERYAAYFTSISKDEWIVYNHKTNPHMAYLDLKRGEPEALRAWKERENHFRYQYNNAIDRLMENGEITLEQALLIKMQVYEEKNAEREERTLQKQEWLDAYAARYERRRAEWHQIHYSESGRRRSSVELLVILGLTVAGVDLFKSRNIDDGIIIPKIDSLMNIEANRHLQYRVDQIYIAAGRKPPSELFAKHKVEQLARKVSLEDQIAAAAHEKPGGSFCHQNIRDER